MSVLSTISDDLLATSSSTSLSSGVLDGLLALAAFAFPAAGPAISIIKMAAPYIIAAAPVIKAAVTEGIPAFEAAKAAAPELTRAIKDFAAMIPTASHPDLHLENVSRVIFGIPHMTPEEEKAWMDRATPGNDPSQENSKFTVG